MITKLVVDAFRGVSQRAVFEPEVLTILTGRNGLGKTTFFDAVDWCLFGTVSRLGSDPSLLTNLYSPGKQPRVEVHLEYRGQSAVVARTASEIRLNDEVVQERELAEFLTVDPDVFPPYLRDLGRQVRAACYLAQDQIHSFVSASGDSERRALFHGLLGVPNAALVESSLRRVSDHFATRERRLLETISRLSDGLTESTLEVDPEVEADAVSLLNSLGERFPGADVPRVRESLDSSLSELERRAVLLESLLVASADTETTVSSVNAELTSLDNERAQLRQGLHAATVAATAGTDRVAAAQQRQQRALDRMSTAERRVASVEAYLAEQSRAESLASGVAEAADRLRQAEEALAAAELNAASTLTGLTEAEQLLESKQRQAALFEERLARESERSEISSRLQALVSELEQADSLVTESEASSHSAELELRAAAARRDDVAMKQRAAASVAAREAQLDALRTQLLSLIRTEDRLCPLCGHEYASHDELRRHVASSAVDSSRSVLKSLTESLGDAERAAKAKQTETDLAGTALADARRRADQLRRAAGELQAALRAVESSLAAVGSSDQVSGLAEAQSNRDRLRLAETTTQATLAECRRLLQDATVAHRRLSAEHQLVLSRVSKQQAPASTPDEARSELRAAEQESVAAAEDLQRIRASQAVLESKLVDARSQLSAADSRVAAETDRKDRAIAQLRSLYEPVGLSVTEDLAAFRIEVSQRLDLIRQQTVADREALARAVAIERRLAINRSAVNEQSMRKELAIAEEDLKTLRSAHDRFQGIAEALEVRSREEAENAGVRHRAAIQECINALYPHRHLNEIDLDFANGEVLVKDRWLSGGVRPEDYSSRGQANVLALSLFLGMALRQSFAENRFIMLDEPVQNLDDLHFLAFLTLLKRIALSRQVIVSTADSNIAEVLRRQLRSWSAGHRRWCEYEWVDFGPQSGPSIVRRDGARFAVA